MGIELFDLLGGAVIDSQEHFVAESNLLEKYTAGSTSFGMSLRYRHPLTVAMDAGCDCPHV